MKIFELSFKMSSIRWAFNTEKWEPSEQELLLASSCIQTEEKDRINRFVYKKDVKASLIGRLLIRKFISESTSIPYNFVKISRDVHNKPVQYNSNDKLVSFNVSHHGSYTVLAGEIDNKKIGVDVMKLEYNGGKSHEEFLRIMSRNLSKLEWQNIQKSSTVNKMPLFFRYWALKESYVKAIGTGLTSDLQKIDFSIQSNLLNNKVITDTSLFIDNEIQSWIFEESLLDPLHCVSVASEYICKQESIFNDLSFKNLTPGMLLQNAIPLLPNDYEFIKTYFLKKA